MPSDDLGTKVAVLEERFSHMVDSMDDLKGLTAETNQKLDKTNERLAEINEIMAKGTGAWWALGVICLVVGGFEAVIRGGEAIVHKMLP